MKKRNVILCFIVAFAAGSFLVSCNKSNQPTVSSLPAGPSVVGDGKIVYVDIDTVFKYYDLFKLKSDSLKNVQKQLDADLKNKQKVFESNVVDAQNKANKGLLTSQNAQEIQQQLGEQKQGLYQLQETYARQLQEAGGVTQRVVYQSIMDYLAEYNKDKKYSYILANSFPGTLLYADPSLNITKIVVSGINEKFKISQSKKKK